MKNEDRNLRFLGVFLPITFVVSCCLNPQNPSGKPHSYKMLFTAYNVLIITYQYACY